MKKLKYIFLTAIVGMGLHSCQQKVDCNCDDKKEEVQTIDVSDKKLDRFGITNKDHLSAASKRALQWDYVENDWYRVFNPMKPLKGDLAYEEGVVRRDPSAVIKVDGLYHVWYSKSIGKTDGFGGDIENDKVFPWDRCTVWHASSKDGWTWTEDKTAAVPLGEKGTYDDRSIFTVEVMEWDGMYYLCYQTIKSPYDVRTKNEVGLAWSKSPYGPWEKSKDPILKPADNGVWRGKEQNRFNVEKKGDFDSHKVHDPCILPYKGKFYLYYKGEQMGEEILYGGRQIRHGVAIADNPKGPYVKSKYNPISNSGHEICVWPVDGGIASLITTDGPERNTFQFSEDGINFEIRGAVKGANMPHAIGLNRTIEATQDNPTAIFDWGLSHVYNSWHYQSILRFDSYRKTSHVAQGAKKPDGKKEKSVQKDN